MPMKMSLISKSVDIRKTHKSTYLKNETFFYSNKKNSLITHQELITH